MNTIRATKEKIGSEPEHWRIWLMDFVDDFRYYKDASMIAEPFDLSDEKTDALLASTVEILCDELAIEAPAWLSKVPASSKPYFVSGIENLKAMGIVQSPPQFKVRQVFVMEDFLTRV